MTTNDGGYQAAFDWHEAGRKVVAIVDTRQSPNGACVSKAADLGIDVITGSAVIDVAGAKRVTGVSVSPISADGDSVTGSVTKLGADTVASSGGWSPVIHLAGHCGSRPVWNEDIVGFLAGPTVEKRLTAGAANGEFTTAGSITQGIEAAKKAIEALGKPAVEVGVPATDATVQDVAMTQHSIGMKRVVKSTLSLILVKVRKVRA